jgi:hypothetical protein
VLLATSHELISDWPCTKTPSRKSEKAKTKKDIRETALSVPGDRVGRAAENKSADPAAVERARKTVLMLDDIYKTAVVLITDKYVNSKKDFPAGRAAKKLFSEISKKGSHEVRLIDASGEPYDPKNVAQDDFDREGIKQLKAGKASYDQVVRIGSKSYLRAITPIPVVMDKCVMCHDNYKHAKKGEPIGALTYTVPLD